jgi:hypothetical protein
MEGRVLLNEGDLVAVFEDGEYLDDVGVVEGLEDFDLVEEIVVFF